MNTNWYFIKFKDFDEFNLKILLFIDVRERTQSEPLNIRVKKELKLLNSIIHVKNRHYLIKLEYILNHCCKLIKEIERYRQYTGINELEEYKNEFIKLIDKINKILDEIQTHNEY